MLMIGSGGGYPSLETKKNFKEYVRTSAVSVGGRGSDSSFIFERMRYACESDQQNLLTNPPMVLPRVSHLFHLSQPFAYSPRTFNKELLQKVVFKG
jgi:hypothetical protein